MIKIEALGSQLESSGMSPCRQLDMRRSVVTSGAPFATRRSIHNPCFFSHDKSDIWVLSQGPPGSDPDLATGFLFTEGTIDEVDQILARQRVSFERAAVGS